MKLSTYFREVYPKRKETIHRWNLYVEQFDETECSDCWEQMTIGEEVDGKYIVPVNGKVLEEFSQEGRAFLHCPCCGKMEYFDKERLIFVKHYRLPTWIPYLLP